MKILVIEDNQEKFNQIVAAIGAFFKQKNITSKLTIEQVTCMKDVHKPINVTKFNLIIFDVYLPFYNETEEEVNVAKDIIMAYKDSLNAATDSIVLTAQPNHSDNTIFNEHGVIFIEYDASPAWVKGLNAVLERVWQTLSYDFLIFCALTKERKAYLQTTAEVQGLPELLEGLDCQKISIGNLKGLCIKPLRMGLVNMAITATRAIELFKPHFVGMSGICAGQGGSSKLLDVIVSTVAWEYQTGKYQNGQFLQEPYQTSLSPEQLTNVSQFIDKPGLRDTICEGLKAHSLLNELSILAGPVASGSLVVADADKMSEIKDSHRKLLGLEMEISAFYETAIQASCKPQYLAIKTATDFGDITKSETEDYQELGAILSARCLVEFIKDYVKP